MRSSAPSRAERCAYWDDTNRRCTTVATANLLIGVAAAAVAGGAGNTTGRVRLNSSFRANDP